MKDCMIAAIILLLTLLFVIGNSLYITNAIQTTESDVQNQCELSEEAQRKIYDAFQKKKRFISLTVNHEDLMSVESGFAEWIGAASAGSREDFEIAKSRLVDSLEHLRRLSGFSAESIF